MEMESHKNACKNHRLPIKKMKCQIIEVISNLVSMTDPYHFTQKQRPKTNNNRVRWAIANCKKTQVELRLQINLPKSEVLNHGSKIIIQVSNQHMLEATSQDRE